LQLHRHGTLLSQRQRRQLYKDKDASPDGVPVPTGYVPVPQIDRDALFIRARRA